MGGKLKKKQQKKTWSYTVHALDVPQVKRGGHGHSRLALWSETMETSCNIYFMYRYMYCKMLSKILAQSFGPGAVARLEACSLGMQAAPSSIPTSGTFFRWDLVMKTFLRPFSFFRWFKKSSCQLLAKECALSTGKLPRRLAQEQCG